VIFIRASLLALASSVLVACYSGGGPASAVPPAEPEPDAETADAGVDGAPVSSPCDDAGRPDGGSTWTDLYRDYFGPTGLASCTALSNCHGASTQTGATNSGFVCGNTKDECFLGITAPLSIVPEGGTATPEQTTLYIALRKAPPNRGGAMPRNSAFAFCPSDLMRIEGWIAAGAAND
jgi:hypothetical protein